MSHEKNIEKAIQRLAGTYLKDIVSILVCNVDSVDADNRVCDCTPIGGDAATQLPGVQLCAENNNGLVVFPKVDSTIIVALSTKNTAFVLMYSDVDKVQFMDGTYGGIIKVKDPDDPTAGLLKKINNLENLLNDLITKYNTHIHTATDSVTFAPVTVLPTTSLETSTIAPITAEADLTNDLVIHGKNP